MSRLQYPDRLTIRGEGQPPLPYTTRVLLLVRTLWRLAVGSEVVQAACLLVGAYALFWWGWAIWIAFGGAR